MKRQRLTAEAKVSILREHLENHISVADICEKYRIHPNQLYQWKKLFFENATELFTKKKPKNQSDRNLAQFEATLRDRNEVIAELLSRDFGKIKKVIWGDLTKRWISLSLRNEIIAYIAYWQKRTGQKLIQIVLWLSLSISKYYDWSKRSTEENRHNSSAPKINWLLPWETEAIITYRLQHFDEGYRRLCFMMIDENIVAVSPTSVYRVLKSAGLLTVQWRHHKAKGSGFIQPTKQHEHWHLDISYSNFKNTFVYLIALIDGYSRYIVHVEVKLSIEALDVEILMERAREKFPGTQPILITDNGSQFIAKEFKTYLQMTGITHRKTRFFYPQSNGKIERFYQTCKNESVRKNSFLDLDDLKKQQVNNQVNSTIILSDGPHA